MASGFATGDGNAGQAVGFALRVPALPSSRVSDDRTKRERDLATYYDQEAPDRSERDIDPGRVARRTEFIEVLRTERRTSVVEIGTGPGRDASAFVAAGFAVTGVDLSAEHVRLARAAGADVRPATVLDLPFDDGSFAAGWTMSTLLHVPNADFGTAMIEICRVLEPGAPLAVGLWGGVDREGPNPRDTIQPRRFFSNRSDDRIRHMLSPFGVIERFETWSDSNVAGWHYQWVVLRMPELPSGRRLDHELA